MISFSDYVKTSVDVINDLQRYSFQKSMEDAHAILVEALSHQKPVLVCGNGGSAADAQHITGEMVGRFLKERQAFRCICLSDNPSVLTALGNDYGYETVFSRQVEAYGEKGGVIIGLSTSGRSPNVIRAFEQAHSFNMKTIAFTGDGGGLLAPLSDVLFAVSSQHTPLIQQAHIVLYHYLCEYVEHTLAR